MFIYPKSVLSIHRVHIEGEPFPLNSPFVNTLPIPPYHTMDVNRTPFFFVSSTQIDLWMVLSIVLIE